LLLIYYYCQVIYLHRLVFLLINLLAKV